MKIPYNLLMTDKEPIIFIEHAVVRMDDGILKAFSDKGTFSISPANHILMILGAGTSITQEAIIFSAQHNMHVAIGRGGCYIHSYWMSGRWSDPQKLVNQVKIHSDLDLRLKYAKELLRYRFIRESAPLDVIERIDAAGNVNQLLAVEANWAKEIYRLERIFNNVDFSRDKNSREGINSRLTLLNNALYSFMTAVILNYGLHPSVGVLHGQTRRGGLAFDLADVFKLELTIEVAFLHRESSFKYCLINFNKRLKENNYKLLKNMIDICAWLSGDKDSIC